MSVSGMIGADIEALERLAGQFDQAAVRLRHHAAAVSDGIQVSAWLGPIALRFQVDWDSTHSVKLKHTAGSLDEAARSLRHNAAEQQRASDGATGSMAAPSSRSSDLVDEEGRPTPDGYLAFAKAAGGQSELPPGWNEVTDDELRELGIDPERLHTEHGLDAMIARDASGHYVLAFEGSKPDRHDVDWTRENARSAGGSGVAFGLTGQAVADVYGALDPGTSTEEAMNLGLALKTAVGVDNMVITGHSLGGRHAAAASIVTGAEATTFNAAGLTNDDVLYARTVTGDDVAYGEYLGGRLTGGASLRAGLDTGQITNYTSSGDPLTAVQNLTPAFGAAGKQVVVGGGGHGLDNFDGKLGAD